MDAHDAVLATRLQFQLLWSIASKFLSIAPWLFWFHNLLQGVNTGSIVQCTITPFRIGALGAIKIAAAVLLLPGAMSSPEGFAILAYILAVMGGTSSIPCAAYLVLPPFHSMTLADLTTLRTMLWPWITSYAVAQSHFHEMLARLPDRPARDFLCRCAGLVVPRLILGARVEGGSGTQMMSSRWWAAALAVFYHTGDAVLPRWCQWLLHAGQYGSPNPTTWAGTEFRAISLLTWWYGYPPVVACWVALVAEVLVHPLRRRIVNGAVESPLLPSMRGAFVVFSRSYVALELLRSFYPGVFRTVVLLVVAATSIVLGAVYLFRLHWLPQSIPRESEWANANTVWKSDAPLHCDLCQIPLDRTPPYYAISYRWPQGNLTSTISVNGATLKVHPELEVILKDARRPIGVIMVWIDQICINQKDKTEKEGQVALMSSIYGNCLRVMASLPMSRDLATSHGVWSSFLRALPLWSSARTETEKDVVGASRLLTNLRDSRRLHDFAGLGREATPLIPITDRDHLKVLHALLSHEWFTRVWVNQEIALVKQVSFLYGSQNIEWRTLVLGATTLVRSELGRFHEVLERPEAAGAINILVRENLRMRLASGDGLDVFQTLVLCMRFQCFLPVDMVYGMLGMVDALERRWYGLEPDYSVSAAFLFQRLAMAMIDRFNPRQKMSILVFAGMRKPDNPTEEFNKAFQDPANKLPSWAPNWAVPLEAAILEHRQPRFDYKASDPAWREEVYMGFVPSDYGMLLHCTGLKVPFREALKAVRDKCAPSDRYRFTNQLIDEAFWRTIAADTHPATWPAPMDHVRENIQRYLEEYEMMREESAGQPTHDVTQRFHHLQTRAGANMRFSHLLAAHLSKTIRPTQGEGNISDILHRGFDITHVDDPLFFAGRQFCITEKGYIGLVPKMSQVKDAVVILCNASTPHVLRPVEGGHEFELVGEAFMHGLMDYRQHKLSWGLRSFRLR